MKVIDKTQEVKFQPIVLEIVIESEAELSEFYHRMNITQNDVKSTYANSSQVPRLHGEAWEASTKVWRVLEEQVDSRDLEHVVWEDPDSEY